MKETSARLAENQRTRRSETGCAVPDAAGFAAAASGCLGTIQRWIGRQTSRCRPAKIAKDWRQPNASSSTCETGQKTVLANPPKSVRIVTARRYRSPAW